MLTPLEEAIKLVKNNVSNQFFTALHADLKKLKNAQLG
jgi:hypothetical protein